MGTPRVTRLLSRTFFDRSPEAVAPDLLGCTLIRSTELGTVAVWITETEAYLGRTDPASHAFGGPSPRNAAMFGPPGHLYVYFTYGMYYCMNLVCGPGDRAGGVLLRAGEVVDGEALARIRRPKVKATHQLARGPACLAISTAVNRSDYGIDICTSQSPIRLRGRVDIPEIRCGPRVGVSRAADTPLRFWIDGERSVSAYKRSNRAPVERNCDSASPKS